MTTRETEQLFETIVSTLLSSKPTNPEVIRVHIRQYAIETGVTYPLARQAVVWTATERLRQRLEQI